MEDRTNLFDGRDLSQRLVLVFARVFFGKARDRGFQLFGRLLHSHAVHLQNPDSRRAFELRSDGDRLEHREPLYRARRVYNFASMNRREVLKSLAAGVVMPVFGSGVPTVTPKALIFDTFGTVVDWRGSIIEEGKTWSKTKGLEIDWAGFADRWRAGYQPAMERVRKGELPWTKLDDLHRMILEQLFMEF